LVSYGKFISISSSTGTCMNVGVMRAPAATMWASRNQIGVKNAQVVAGRRSSNTASRQRRKRRVNNRKSFSFSSEAFASVRITHRHQKEAQPEGQHDDIQHEVLLVAVVSGRDGCSFRERFDGSRATTKTHFFNTIEPERKSRSYSITSAESHPDVPPRDLRGHLTGGFNRSFLSLS
jgi:hypothetical protein